MQNSNLQKPQSYSRLWPPCLHKKLCSVTHCTPQWKCDVFLPISKDLPAFSNVSTVFQYFTPANSSHSDIWRNMSVIFKVFKNSPEILSFWTDSTCFYALNSLHCCKINFIKWGRQLEGFIWHLTTCAKLAGEIQKKSQMF